MRTRARAVGFGLFLTSLAIAGCTTEPTQILVTVAGDPGFAEVAVEVDGDEVARTALPLDGGRDLPLTLTLLHSGGGLGPIAVGAVGYGNGGAEQARSCAFATFRRGATVRIELELEDGVRVPCTEPPGDGGPGDDGGGPGEDGGVCEPAVCAATGGACVAGECVPVTCGPNREDCDAEVPGCETDTRNDSNHCGGCNKPCPQRQRCRNGMCRGPGP